MIGWRRWDATTGFILMAAIFVIMIILGSLILLRVKDLSWLSVYMPYIFGTVYGFLPDSIPFSIDDAAATTAGAIFSFTLALRKQSGTPKWIIVPLLAAGMYALLGGLIPGPVDEFLVDALALILAWIGTRQGNKDQI
jgi:predicted neutral ceramidase superfamily lipid hydrolase